MQGPTYFCQVCNNTIMDQIVCANPKYHCEAFMSAGFGVPIVEHITLIHPAFDVFVMYSSI